jgi:hypothetical protein
LASVPLDCRLHQIPLCFSTGGFGTANLNLLLAGMTDENDPATGRLFRIEADCQVYFAVEEMLISIAPHGDGLGRYDVNIYIKEATASGLMNAFTRVDPEKFKGRRHGLVL